MILSDVATIYDCPHSTAPDEGEGYPLIRTPNIGKGRLILDDVHRVSKEVYDIRNKRAIPQENDIIFAREAPAGNAALITKGQKVCLGQRTVLIRPKQDLVDPHYLVYYLLAPQQQIKLLGFSHGATVGHVNIPDITKLSITLPSLTIQKSIARIVEHYDNLTEVNNKRIKMLEQMAENLYKEWFVRFRFPGHESVPFENGLPQGWKIKRVDAIGEVIGGGTPSTNVDSFWDGTIPWLTPADLSNTNRILIRRGSTNISSEGLKRSGATMMPPDTVLVSSRAPIGYIAIAANPICTNQGFKSVVCFDDIMSPYYLFFFFRSNRDMLQNYATGATFPELSGSRMKKIKVLVPDIQLQKSFERIAKSIICEMDKLEEANDLLRHQRDLLLPRLMSGKLEVQATCLTSTI